MQGFDKLSIVLDFDGVLVESTPMLQGVLTSFLNAYGKEYASYLFEECNGKTLEEIVSFLKLELDLDPDLSELLLQYRQLMDAVYNELVLADGATEFLHFCQALNLPLGIASGAKRCQIFNVLDRAGFGGFFDAICTADDVEEGKPSPEVFNKVKSLIGNDFKFIVFDDAANGITGAEAANMTAYMFGNSRDGLWVRDFSQASSVVLNEVVPRDQFRPLITVDAVTRGHLQHDGSDYEIFCREAAERSPNMFDGPVLLLEEMVEREGNLSCSLVSTTYLNYQFALRNWVVQFDCLPIKVCVSSICSLSGVDKVIVGRRSHNVSTYRGRLELVGSGNLEVGTAPENQVVAELVEECGIKSEAVKNISLLGFYFDFEQAHFDLCYHVELAASPKLESQWEYDEIEVMDVEALVARRLELIPTSKAMFEHFTAKRV